MSGVFDEVAACGTAVIITPVGQIDREVLVKPVDGADDALEDVKTMWNADQAQPTLSIESVKFKTSDFEGFKQLYTTYRQIQYGTLPDNFGWMFPKEGI